MPLIPMRDRLVLKEIPHDQTPIGLTIVRNETQKNMMDRLTKSGIRCKVLAQGVGMLVGEEGQQFEISLPKVHQSEVVEGGEVVMNWNLVGMTVIVSSMCGVEDEDPVTGEKLIIAKFLDIEAVVEGN